MFYRDWVIFNGKSSFLIFRSLNQILITVHLYEANAEKLEKLQYRAWRIVFSDFTSSYASLLEKAEPLTLHLNRPMCIAAETYKT